MISKKEHVGSIFALLTAAIWGLFPILITQYGKNIPPIAFAGMSVLVASIAAFVYMLFQKKLHELKKFSAYKNLFFVTLFIVILPYLFYFPGAIKTSSVNASLLLLSEIIFTILFTPLFGEKTTKQKLIGMLGIFFGALCILYKDNFSFHSADLLIIFSTIFYPFGNFYSKKALNDFSPSTVLFFRSLVGGTLLVLLSFFFENNTSFFQIANTYAMVLLVNGIFLLAVSKIFWYEALKRLDISKAISLSMTFPFFSLLVLLFFFDQKFSPSQLLGIGFMALGAYFSLKRPSVDPQKTKYRAS